MVNTKHERITGICGPPSLKFDVSPRLAILRWKMRLSPLKLGIPYFQTNPYIWAAKKGVLRHLYCPIVIIVIFETMMFHGS